MILIKSSHFYQDLPNSFCRLTQSEGCREVHPLPRQREWPWASIGGKKVGSIGCLEEMRNVFMLSGAWGQRELRLGSGSQSFE